MRLADWLSLAAFVMSLSITLLNVYFSLRGSEIAVERPSQVILYKDGRGEESVLTAAVRLDLMNTSDSYGDVLREATISLDGGKTSFSSQSTIKAVLADGAVPSAECQLDLRCMRLPGLRITEQNDEILETPPANARVYTVAFPLISWNCKAQNVSCASYDKFSTSAEQIGEKGLTALIRLRFHSDGEKRLKCRVDSLDMAYLKKVGWVSAQCRTNS